MRSRKPFLPPVLPISRRNNKKRPLESVKLFAGLLFSEPQVFEEAKARLSKKFGPIDLESGVFGFDHTDYYSGEMGEGLKRKFLSFQKLKNAEALFAAKRYTNSLEDTLSASERRRVNIDPGYLTLGKVVLFSTKDYTHRVYLKKGIFAEVTLYYKNGSYTPWDWTYPDYKTEGYIQFFNQARNRYAEDLKRPK